MGCRKQAPSWACLCRPDDAAARRSSSAATRRAVANRSVERLLVRWRVGPVEATFAERGAFRRPAVLASVGRPLDLSRFVRRRVLCPVLVRSCVPPIVHGGLSLSPSLAPLLYVRL